MKLYAMIGGLVVAALMSIGSAVASGSAAYPDAALLDPIPISVDAPEPCSVYQGCVPSLEFVAGVIGPCSEFYERDRMLDFRKCAIFTEPVYTDTAWLDLGADPLNVAAPRLIPK